MSRPIFLARAVDRSDLFAHRIFDVRYFLPLQSRFEKVVRGIAVPLDDRKQRATSFTSDIVPRGAILSITITATDFGILYDRYHRSRVQRDRSSSLDRCIRWSIDGTESARPYTIRESITNEEGIGIVDEAFYESLEANDGLKKGIVAW